MLNKFANILITICIIVVIVLSSYVLKINISLNNNEEIEKSQADSNDEWFKLLMSNENQDLEDELVEFAKSQNINLSIDYSGTLDMISKLNNGEKYDAIWTSNSIWLYMLNNKVSIKNSKSTSINPVVFGIRRSKAEELGFIDNDVYMNDILKAISNKKLKFNMSSATQTNSGASAYLGFVATLAGNPEILTEEMLDDENLQKSIITLLSGVERSSGSEEFLEEMFLNGNYDCVVTYEASLIEINKKLEQKNKETLYLIYPVDGVSISDSPFAYIDNGDKYKENVFNTLQEYVLGEKFQNKLENSGRRTWYGGINNNANKNIFNPDWGIDTSKYITAVKYPSVKVIRLALGLYQNGLKKPTHTIFCLDYSLSMKDEGIIQLQNAMKYILDEKTASENYLQFSIKDKITVIPFCHEVINIWQVDSGKKTEELIDKIEKQVVIGGTNIYDTLIKALEIAKNEKNEYNTSIVLMTDGYSNVGSFNDLENYYQKVGSNIPIYSIMFGDASSKQLNEISKYTNAKVFDGKTNLVEAFKKVRGYN